TFEPGIFRARDDWIAVDRLGGCRPAAWPHLLRRRLPAVWCAEVLRPVDHLQADRGTSSAGRAGLPCHGFTARRRRMHPARSSDPVLVCRVPLVLHRGAVYLLAR